MTIRIGLTAILLLVLAAPLSAADAVGVAGAVVLDSGQTLVRLVNPTTKASAWVKVGDTFANYQVTAFESSADGRTDTVVLTSGNSVLRLRIAIPKIASTVAATPTTRGGPPDGQNPPGSAPAPSAEPPAPDAAPPAPPDPPSAP